MVSRNFDFKNILDSEIRLDTINVQNSGSEPLKISFAKLPKHLIMKAIPKVLQPSEFGKIIISFMASKKKDYGYFTDIIKIKTSSKSRSRNGKIIVTGTILEDFSRLTKKELIAAPIISFNEKIFNFGKIQKGNKRKCSFDFSNLGKDVLIIRKIETISAFTIISFNEVVKPSQSGQIEFEFKAFGSEKQARFPITIISNDPTNSYSTLFVEACIINENSENQIIHEISLSDVMNLIRNNSSNQNFIILDVRTYNEFINGHIPKTINIDYYSENFKKNLLKLPRDKIYLIYCKKGIRSRFSAEIMSKNGFKFIFNFSEGIDEWKAEDLPLQQ